MLSGAADFVAKYQEMEMSQTKSSAISGLGFYSAFMVADRVQIDTLSYQKAEAVSGFAPGTEYQMSPSDRKERGTTVTLYWRKMPWNSWMNTGCGKSLKETVLLCRWKFFLLMSIPEKRNMTKRGKLNQ